MKASNKIILVIVAVAVSVLSVALLRAKNREQAAEIARMETERVLAELEHVRAENAEIREILARSYDAIQAANAALERAHHGHVERTEQILESDRDWLDEPLPDGVRDAFRICADGIVDPAPKPSGAVCASGDEGAFD